MNGLVYTHFEKSEYLNSPLFNAESLQLLLALRTRTVRGIKNDFRDLYTDIKCPLKCGEDDITKHVLERRVLKSHHYSREMSNDYVIYEDTFTRSVLKQKQVTELYRQLLDIINLKKLVNIAKLSSSWPVPVNPTPTHPG